ncbi:MAG TPA: hypothetical protein VKT31_02720 [Solirubrobacteraceae bacterium]|nr:hypothetical protein [Solirubrobacteraceae bacterium]
MTTDPIVRDYLNDLRRAARRLDKARARELQAEIEAHLQEAIPEDASEAQVRNELERLGTPEEIVEAERPAPPPAAAGIHEWAAIFLLLFGGFIFLIGWFAGLILLWSSRCWRTSEKWLGTMLIPGGLAAVLPLIAIVGSAQTCVRRNGITVRCTPVSGPLPVWVGWLFLILVVAGPIATTIFLARRARTPAALR